MPINREYITSLFLRYNDTLSFARQLVESAPEIPLYQFTLESSSEFEYIPVLCEIIHGHLHWRISGYSYTRAVAASAAEATARMTSHAAQRGATIATSAAQRGATMMAGVAQRGVDTVTTYFGLPQYPMRIDRPTADDIGNPADLPSPPRFSPRSHHSPRGESPHGHSPISSARAPLCAVRAIPMEGFEDVLVLDDDDDAATSVGMYAPEQAQTLDPRISLFNDIIKHIFHSDLALFQTQIMSIAFTKLVMSFIVTQGGRRSTVYNRLFFPPEMTEYIENKYINRPIPTM